jgi:orotidine-5'-phosphate decarboxylase
MNSRTASPGEKIIVALDVPTARAALDLVEQLRHDISFFKIGLQLYTAAGPDIVRQVLATGSRVFLDLKLHDIPNTVGGAVESADELGVQMLTIHLSGGQAMVRAAVSARKKDLSLLGVTVLTSIDEPALQELGVSDNIEHHVARLATIGAAAGIDGLVASPKEVKFLREKFGPQMKLVVPGIRPAGAEAADQKRVMSPREALEAGANYLVIGRPIIAHSNPRAAVAQICDEIAG